MKVKLLRKIRKKYDWYFNKDGYPVLINYTDKTVVLYDLEYLCKRYEYKVDDLLALISVPYTEWAIRCLKTDILKKYGWSMNRTRYRIAILNLNRRRNKQ